MSDSVGIKISLPGYSVENATPEQCSVDSAYDSLKMKLDPNNPQFGNISVTFQDNPAQGTYQVAVINHNYGYVPAVYFYYDLRSSTLTILNEVGNIFPLDELNEAYFEVIVNDNQVIINYVVTEFASDTPSGKTANFKYYIFANNGI